MMHRKIQIMPFNEAKMTAYIQGELGLVKRRKDGKHFFIKTKPKGGTITPQRRAYFRVWYFRENVQEYPQAAAWLDAFYKKTFPDSYRGPRQPYANAPAASARAPRPRRSLSSLSRAYRRGYNAAYRSQGAKLQAMAAPPRAVKAATQEPKKGFLQHLTGLFS
jgi:hypothetical protein